MKKLLVIYIAWLATCAIAQDLKPVTAAFVAATNIKAAPAINLLHKTPPVPIELRIDKPTLVHFWATWCAPCVHELPALVAASKAYTASGVNVIIISVDASAASKVPPFLDRLGLAGTPIFWDPRSDLYKKFAVQLLPTTIVLNSKGQEVGRMAGAVGWQGQADIEFLKKAASRF